MAKRKLPKKREHSDVAKDFRTATKDEQSPQHPPPQPATQRYIIEHFVDKKSSESYWAHSLHEGKPFSTADYPEAVKVLEDMQSRDAKRRFRISRITKQVVLQK